MNDNEIINLLIEASNMTPHPNHAIAIDAAIARIFELKEQVPREPPETWKWKNHIMSKCNP